MDLISIIVPVYKVEPYLHKCVRKYRHDDRQDIKQALQ